MHCIFINSVHERVIISCNFRFWRTSVHQQIVERVFINKLKINFCLEHSWCTTKLSDSVETNVFSSWIYKVIFKESLPLFRVVLFPGIPENTALSVAGSFRKLKPEFFIEWNCTLGLDYFDVRWVFRSVFEPEYLGLCTVKELIFQKRQQKSLQLQRGLSSNV